MNAENSESVRRQVLETEAILLRAEVARLRAEALDLTRLVVAVVEERHGHIERIGDLLQTRRANAVDALLVLLDLLEADAELFAELRLRDLLFDPPQPDSLAKFDVGLASATLFHSLCC